MGTGPDVYEDLIVNVATNATNAIKNNDNTYSGFTQDANNILKVGTEIISKKKLLWSGAVGASTTVNTITLNESILNKKLYIEVSSIHGLGSYIYTVIGGYTFNPIEGAFSYGAFSEKYSSIYFDTYSKTGEVKFVVRENSEYKELQVTGTLYDISSGTTSVLGEFITAIYEIIE